MWKSLYLVLRILVDWEPCVVSIDNRNRQTYTASQHSDQVRDDNELCITVFHFPHSVKYSERKCACWSTAVNVQHCYTQGALAWNGRGRRLVPNKLILVLRAEAGDFHNQLSWTFGKTAISSQDGWTVIAWFNRDIERVSIVTGFSAMHLSTIRLVTSRWNVNWSTRLSWNSLPCCVDTWKILETKMSVLFIVLNAFQVLQTTYTVVY